MAISPIPSIAPMTTEGGYVGPDWYRWLYELWNALNTSSTRIGSTLTLTGQHATIATTAIPLPSLTGAALRLNWYARVTTADAVSSSLTVTLGWTEGSQALTKAVTAITGNTVTSVDAGSFPIQPDQGTGIKYATTYVSNTPNAMQYSLRVWVENLG